LKTWSASWLFWALLSAIFAAVTVIFAKLGVISRGALAVSYMG
jgi:uncharacterized membrane protein